MRIGRKAASDAYGVANFSSVANGGEADVVDLRIGAPRGAAGRRDFELARQVVELRICGRATRRSPEPMARRRSTHRRRPRRAGSRSRCAQRRRKRPLGESPMASSASTTSGNDSMVSQCSWIFWRTVMSARLRAYLRVSEPIVAQLAGGEDAVGDADAHHEVVGRQTLAAFAAGRADAIALGVDAPPFEVGRGPFGHDAGSAFASEGAHFIERLPRVLLALKALDALSLGFFHCDSFRHFSFSVETESPRQLELDRGPWEPWEYVLIYRVRSPMRAKKRTAATTGLTLHALNHRDWAAKNQPRLADTDWKPRSRGRGLGPRLTLRS